MTNLIVYTEVKYELPAVPPPCFTAQLLSPATPEMRTSRRTQTSGQLGAPGDLECEPGALASFGLASSE